MLGYWCDFKFSTEIDAQINPRNEIAWNNRKILVGKNLKIMEKALKIAWVKRIQDESQASWKIIPDQLLAREIIRILTKRK